MSERRWIEKRNPWGPGPSGDFALCERHPVGSPDAALPWGDLIEADPEPPDAWSWAADDPRWEERHGWFAPYPLGLRASLGGRAPGLVLVISDGADLRGCDDPACCGDGPPVLARIPVARREDALAALEAWSKANQREGA